MCFLVLRLRLRNNSFDKIWGIFINQRGDSSFMDATPVLIILGCHARVYYLAMLRADVRTSARRPG